MPSDKPRGARSKRSIKAEIDEIKRREILAEAVRLFYENGFDTTTLESIADALGVTKPYIYSRFSSKMDILAAICLLGAAPAQKTVEFSTTLGGDAPTQLAQVMEYFITLQIAHRMEVALFFRDAHNLPPDKSREIDKSRMAFHKMLCSILDEGKKAGDFHFDNVSLTASALGGMASWIFTWYQPDGRWTSPVVAKSIAKLSLKTAGKS
ncbi:TetR/AcrR family transcriptional regulator [Sphingopyxis panaciterrulae]|uniref:AcrR family transcriptional regulator n=1 Tax=Sphingopyxis panaciterrulae TaxID=462372 RepID=A0A7W9B710_9SPHN|nr:TetR/AcrR family transcriptional regulator [Sphingopyxis panaciterrulae]MBB5707044.1 AcrR family transcriptional regulator [Sphingopyxis panaciterrulae]